MEIHSEQTKGWIKYTCPERIIVESAYESKLNSVHFYLKENSFAKILDFSTFYKFFGFIKIKEEINIYNNTINKIPVSFKISRKLFNSYIEFNINSDVFHIIYQTSSIKSIHKNGKQVGLISDKHRFYDNKRLIQFNDDINYRLILSFDFISLIEFNEFFVNYSEINIALPYKAKAIYKMDENWKPNQS